MSYHLIKLFLGILVGFVFIIYGTIFLKKSLNSSIRYDLKEDVKHSFFTPHRTYSSFLNYDEMRPGRIMPSLIILAGIAIILLGIFKPA